MTSRKPHSFARSLLQSGMCVFLGLAIIPAAVGQTSVSPSGQTRTSDDEQPSDQLPKGPPTTQEVGLSDAEKIARLERSIGETRELFDSLRTKLDDPKSEYAEAQADFIALDSDLESKKKEHQRLLDGGDRDGAADLLKQIEQITAKHTLAKERFDLAIQERKAQQEQIAMLETKLGQDKEALSKLKGEPSPAASQPSEAPPPATAAEGPSGIAASRPSAPAPGQPEPVAKAPVPATPAPPAAPDQPAPSSPEQPLIIPPQAPPSEELIKAREVASEKDQQAQLAQQEVESVTERMASMRKALELEQKLFETARRRVDNARQTERTLYEELQTKWQDGAPQAEIKELRAKINESRQRLNEAEQEIRQRTDRIDKLQDEVASLQAEHIAALEEAEQKSSEAVTAREEVETLENPFSPANLMRWATLHGPPILGIILGAALLLWLVRFLENRIVRLLAGRVDHGRIEDRENRAKTLVGVFHSVSTMVIYTGGILMILTEIGVYIVPLIGGVAVVGLAVAFGAQNLIRDYFYGFMILLENQYTVNDVVQIGQLSGQVERITLRITMLRGLDGTVHFIPNGQITSVSNMTHGWSRALFDITVAYKEDVDRVINVLMELGRELRRDPEYRGMIMEMPEMLGVDALGDSAVVIKFYIKTRPLKQWTIKREMLRRIKKKFDELGIEIPFPHRTVYHRYEPGEQAGIPLAGKPTDDRPSPTASGRPST